MRERVADAPVSDDTAVPDDEDDEDGEDDEGTDRLRKRRRADSQGVGRGTSRTGDRRSRRRVVRPRVQRQVADMQRQRSTCSRSTSATPGRAGCASGEVTAEIMAVTLTLRV
ncbi:hypothetical protein GCM10009863_43170 [Streptomyces axinellae]|uniref:Uncharacterized protein n=1 Tax=Streptomyces axinellae TaxID=552788 RepID=A0ABN3QE65_9ACTN